MQHVKVDYIIVGQGIAGTWLSRELLKRGKKIIVINHETENTASLKAAGLYNPITGRKMVKTWMADELFKSLEKEYKALENQISAKFLHSIPIYRSFQNIESKNDWDGKQSSLSGDSFIKELKTSSSGLPFINDPLGGIIVDHTGYVDLPVLIEAFRIFLKNEELYESDLLDHREINFKENSVSYKGWKASKIIFCEGSSGGNPFWEHLPFKLVRGELIDITCDAELPYIFNQGVFMIPKGDIITVGSTYDHSVLSYEPQQKGIDNLKNRLEKVFSAPYEIIAKRAGIRPATHDRKPFIGFHHERKTLAIFNGFGTKGVSLTPYFAKHFADVLENKCEIDKEVDVQRVS
ncbi:MAG: NAD(P)/FAD-dependent oxidoreductase [Ekhidna sp.]